MFYLPCVSTNGALINILDLTHATSSLSGFFAIRADRSHCFFMSDIRDNIFGCSLAITFLKTSGYLPPKLPSTVILRRKKHTLSPLRCVLCFQSRSSGQILAEHLMNFGQKSGEIMIHHLGGIVPARYPDSIDLLSCRLRGTGQFAICN